MGRPILTSSRVFVALACVAATACGGLSGCAVGDPAEDDAIPLSAEAYRSREDDAAGGRIHVRIANTGDAPVAVTSVALDSPGFEAAPATRREVELGPGNRIDVETEYGPVRCDTSPESAYALIGVADRDGSPVRVPLAAPYDVLARIHDGDCAAEDLARAVPVTLIPAAAPPEPTAPLPAQLIVSRGTASGDVRVDEIGGSVLYALHGTLPATMRAGEDRLSVDITIDAARCDPHARGGEEALRLSAVDRRRLLGTGILAHPGVRGEPTIPDELSDRHLRRAQVMADQEPMRRCAR